MRMFRTFHPTSGTAVAYAFLMHAITWLSWSADSDKTGSHKHEQARTQAHLSSFSQLAVTSANGSKA